MLEINGKYTSAEVFAETFEDGLIGQITKMTNHIAFTNPIKIMPDCHIGKGSCVGFTMPSSGKVVPNVIGVDIGCGVLSVRLNEKVTDLKEFDDKARAVVPVGFDIHNKGLNRQDMNWFIAECNKNLDTYYKAHDATHLGEFTEKKFKKLMDKIGASPSRVLNSFGTLGGG